MSYASVYEQTHSRQCCNLLISWLWTQPVIVLPMARACDDQSTVHLDWQLGGYSSTRVRNVWGINSVLLRISIRFSCRFAGFYVANRAVIHVCYYCAVWIVLAHFGSEYSRARPSTGRSGQVIDSVCMAHFSWRDSWPIRFLGSTVAVAAPARLRLVVRCALVRTDKLSAVRYDPLSHSRDNAGDRSTKVGHAIMIMTQTMV